VLSSLDFDVNVSVARGGTLWSFDAGLSRGVSWLGALDDPAGLPETAPRAQFTKLTLGAGLTRGFDLLGVRSQLSSTWSGQWSNDVLYSSEQITIAGPFSVRGYRDVRLFGDRGMTWRNELGFPFSLGSGGVQPISVRPFIGADAGRVFAHETTPTGYMTGWATGVNVARFPMSLQLSWSGAGPRSRELPSDHLFFARLAASF
jgi:hemolysin activation/secretion protein